MKIVLWPFIFIMRVITFILKTPLYFLLGVYYSVYKIMLGIIYLFIFLSFLLYKVFKYVFLAFFYLGVLIYETIGNLILSSRANSDQKQIDKELKQREKEKQERLERQKKKIDQEIVDIRKKKSKEDKDIYINENAKREKVKLSDRINNALEKIAAIPKNIKKSFVNGFKGLSLVKNLQNQKNIKAQALLIDFEGEDAEKSDQKLMYQYVAKRPDGKVVKSYFEAFSKVEVHSFLLSEGYEVYSIKTSKWIRFLHSGTNTGHARMRNKDLIFLLTQLSTYIKSGIPLAEALKILSRQYKKKSFQRIFRAMIYDLTMGANFSEALEKQGNTFPRLLINMVKASELTGELPEALDNMADYFTEIDKTRKQMVTALMYPTIVFIVSIAVITFIMLFVIPRFVSIYASLDESQIPSFTRAVLAVSNFLQANILYLFGGIILALLLFAYLYKNVRVFRTLVQWVVMHIPVIGNIFIYSEVTTFTKTFATLLSHNVFITESMEILNKITNNEIYKMIILDTINNLAKGEKISTAFKHWAFPVPAYEMIVTGERTGQLAEMMKKVADYYQELHRNAVTRVKTFIEPILIIFLTVTVGIIVLAIIIPMFDLYSVVQNQ